MPDHRQDQNEMHLSGQSAVERMVKQREEKEKAQESIIEEEKEWAAAINSLVKTPDGLMLVKYMLRHNKLFGSKKKLDGMTLVNAQGRQEVFTDLIFKYLTPENRGFILQNIKL